MSISNLCYIFKVKHVFFKLEPKFRFTKDIILCKTLNFIKICQIYIKTKLSIAELTSATVNNNK